jgi:predicted enzyme related to lactoylglutathione lyase
MGQPVTHFEVHGKDAAALQAFYKELFDWHVDSNNPMNYGMVDTHGGERGINGGIAPDDESWVTFYVEVDDLQAALDRAEKLGGKTVLPPSDVPGGPSLAIFQDPAGNRIGLAKGM